MKTIGRRMSLAICALLLICGQTAGLAKPHEHRGRHWKDRVVSVTVQIAPSNISEVYNNGASYATAWSTSNGFANDALNYAVAVRRMVASDWEIHRSLLAFDTSVIPSNAQIVSARLSLVPFAKIYGTGVNAFDVEIRQMSWVSPLDASTREAAYDAAVGASLDAVLVNTNGLVTDTRYDSELLDPNWINLEGLTTYALVASTDVFPAVYNPITDNGGSILFYSNGADVELRPYLEITYETGGNTVAEGIIFAKGHLIAEGAGPAGADVEFGELQDCSLESRDTYKEARGPDSVYPLAREIAERSTTFRARYLKVKAQGLALLTGGTVSYAANETTIAIGKTSLPSTFKAVLKSPSDGTDIELVLYKVSPSNLSLPFAMRDFSIPGFEFEVLVDEDNNDKVCDIILPGYQSTN